MWVNMVERVEVAGKMTKPDRKDRRVAEVCGRGGQCRRTLRLTA